MLFHTTKWGWKRIATRLLLVPVLAANGLEKTASAAPNPNVGMRAAAPAGDPKALLKEAKAALAAGDLNRAQDLTQQAEASNATGKWGLFDETPASLRKKISAARSVADKNEIEQLSKQARALIGHPAPSVAERAANLEQALKMARRADYLHGPDYSVWEMGDRPDRLIKEIDAAVAKLNPSRLPTPPTQASALQAQQAGKPKPQLRLPPPPVANAAANANPQPPVPTSLIPANGVQPVAGVSRPSGDYAVVQAGGVKPAGNDLVAPGGAKSKRPVPSPDAMAVTTPPLFPHAAPPMPIAPTMPGAAPAATPDMKRAAAELYMAEARKLSARGEFVAARAKLIEADRMNAVYGPNEGPGYALQELNVLAAEVKEKLVREVKESTAKKDFVRAEAALAGASEIAAGLSLSARDIEEARLMLQQANGSQGVIAAGGPLPPSDSGSVIAVGGVAPPATALVPPAATRTTANTALPSMMIAPPTLPDRTTPQTMASRPAAPATTPGNLTGKQLLDQAAFELEKGDLAMARRVALHAYNLGGVNEQAQALLNQIDVEGFNRKKIEAVKSFDNAVKAFESRDYALTLGVLTLIDAKMLPPEKKAKCDELIAACQAEMNGPRGGTGVQTAAAQLPAAPLASPSVETPRLASKVATPNDPPLISVDPQPAREVGAPKAADPQALVGSMDSPAKQAHAMREIQFQKVREEGLRAMSDAQAAFGRGETDVAINILNDYTNRVRASTLEGPKIAILLRPIDNRLDQYRVMKGHVDSLTREKKEKKDARDLIAGRNAAEEQRRAEVTRLVREYHVLVKEKKDYAAAERVAMQAKQLDPDNPAVEALAHMAKVNRRVKDYEKIKNSKEAFVLSALNQAEQQGPLVSIDDPVSFKLETYSRLGRRGVDDPYQKSRTAAEFDIEMKLERPVSLSFDQTPLNLAVENVAEKAQIQVWFDKAAINAEGAGSLEQPIDAKFNVSAKNALALILESAGLSYVIENDVVKVTTIKKSKGRLFTKVFSVADLVTPVPNFALPDYANLSKILGKSAIDNPQAVIGNQTTRGAMGMGQMASQPAGFSGDRWDSKGQGGKLDNVSQGGNPATQGTTNNGFGTQFTQSMTKHEQLIKLVTGMVRPLSWDASGGNGKIEFYDIGSALVVNQTGDVIKEVADLLEALRRLQDLAVAIEMRIVSLSETFFERMGVDFAVNIQTSNTSFEPNLTSGVFRPDPFINSLNGIKGTTVGLTPAGTFTPDLNVPIRSTSFDYAIPSFGGYPNNPGANGGVSLGLAFLNDIQVYMFMEAAQGDRRQNIMQAPKLTLFNGQTATISITDFAYFVTNVQVYSVNGQVVFVPQNTPLPIGTQGGVGGQIGVQAVVSADRRFVRITPTVDLQTISGALTPLFPVTTFITPVFEGGSQGQPIPFTQFLQQPSLATISVQTTVVCPDGGTVLMGGFKYLAEGRNEFGPPFLSKIPYLNRLFKNVGIGRETRHLMLMITPRIIITAEEELIQTEGVRFPGQPAN